MMKLFSLTLLSFALAGNLPNSVKIAKFSSGGVGCTDVKATLSPRGDELTVKWWRFMSTSGPGSSRSSKHPNCYMQMTLEHDAGYKWTYESIDFGPGRVNLTQGGSAYVQLRVLEPNVRPNSGKYFDAYSDSIKGPSTSTFRKVVNIDLGKTLWSVCDKQSPMDVMTYVSCSTNDDKPNSITLGGDSTGVVQTIKLAWQKC
jgi:hypothetical protein